MPITSERLREHAQVVPPASLLSESERLIGLYDDCFGAPPWNEDSAQRARFRAHLPWLLRSTGLRAAVCRQEAGAIVAVALGRPIGGALPTPHATHDALLNAVCPWLHQRLLDSFCVLELMVEPAARRGGRGTAVLNAVTAGQPGWLLTHRDGPGPAFYAAAGWYRAASFQRDDGTPLQLWMKPGSRGA